MALTVTHTKTNAIADWSQAELDYQISLGNYPSGTTLADIVLPSDWNAEHFIEGLGVELIGNTTSDALANGATFTGDWVDVSEYGSVVTACKTDQGGTLYMEFSPDGTNADSSLSFSVTANVNEVHRISVTRKWFRVRYTNTSSSVQAYFRLQSLAGHQPILTSALNSQIQSDADAILVRPLDFNLAVAESLYQNRTNTIKDGVNADIDTASVPEDIWSAGGAYTGFPAAAAAAEIVVAGADTGTVYYSYMATDTDTDYTFGSKAITGAGTYSLGHNVWRCNFAYFVSSNPADFNAGLITIRHTATPSNIFVTIDAGISQSYCSAYTVPYGSSVYIDRISGTLRGSSTGSADGYFYYRQYGESPRLRFPFVLQFGSLYFDDVDYLVRIPERTDIMPITASSANNLSAQISYRLLKTKS
jgi:hypothetical protein